MKPIVHDAPEKAPKPIELRVALPASLTKAQDAEWCVVDAGHGWQEIRFHDYAAIYAVPGLYETLFHHHLQCRSPQVVVDQLLDATRVSQDDPRDLRVLDVGAGNGIVGEELRSGGVEHIVGVDLLPEAKHAALRDRPGVYAEYHVEDLTQLADSAMDDLGSFHCNAMTCVAALGFGDIPTAAFARAFGFVEAPGWVAFNIKEDFLNVLDPTGFGELIRTMVEERIIKVVSQQRYRHRLGMDGDPIHYIAVVAEKTAEVPERLLASSM